MPDTKISALTAATAGLAADEFAINEAGVSKKLTLQQIADYVPAAAPTTADYLVGTAQAGLSAEIVAGTTPGGELGGTWASPTVDAVHSGSAHLALGSTSSTAAAGDHTHAGGGGWGYPYTVRPDNALDSSNVGIPDGTNRAVYHRLVDSGTVTKVYYFCATASGNISVGFFANSGAGRAAVPGARTSTSGAIVCPSAGYIETTVPSVAVAYGDWVGISADNTTCTFKSAQPTGAGNNLTKGASWYQATGHPLPNPPSSLTVGPGRLYVMGGAA